MNPPSTLNLPGSRFIGLPLLTVLMLGCQPKIDPALVYGPDGQPRIISVQVPGIPDQNIQVDQTTHTIAVTVPVNFSATAVPTRFQLTADTRVTSAHSDSLYIYPFTPNDTIKITTSAPKTNAYQFVFKPTSEVKLAHSNYPLVLTVNPYNNYLCLPIYNLLDGDLKSTLVLTNKRSGQQITQPQYFAAECVRANEDRTDGAFFANFYISGQSLYEPGDYTAEFVRSDGQRATFDQTIQIQRGSISIYFPSEESISLAENAIAPRFYASNLFPTDKPELLMNTRGQSPFVVKPATFLTMPLGFELPVLGNLQPGYYYAHLLLDSKPVNSFVRIAVARSFSDLVIQNLSDPVAQSSYSLLDPSQSFDTPVVLKHDKFYTLETNAYTSYLYKVKPGEVAVSRVRLTSLTDPSSFYLTSLLNDTSLSGNLLFPSTIPLGLYQLKFEILTPDKTILSSQPLERDVIIE